MKKLLFAFVLASLLITTSAFALTCEDLKVLIAALNPTATQTAALYALVPGGCSDPQPQPDWCFNFDLNITFGSEGKEVIALKTALAREGFATNKSELFDEETAAAVVKFQAKYGILQTGYVGPLTRAALNKLYGCGVITPVPQPPVPYPVNQIKVLSPNGGEVWRDGNSYNITWTYKSPILARDRLYIYFDSSNGKTCQIGYTLAENGSMLAGPINDGQYCGPDTSYLFPTGPFKIRITTSPNSPVFSDSSDGYVTLNSGIITPVPIPQPPSSCPRPYHVLMPDNRCVWSCGVGTTPDNATNQCACQSGLTQTGTDSFGRITCGTTPTPVQPPISVSLPRGGEVWQIGSTKEIGWSDPNYNYASGIQYYVYATTQGGSWYGKINSTGERSLNWQVGRVTVGTEVRTLSPGNYWITVVKDDGVNPIKAISAGSVELTAGAIPPTTPPPPPPQPPATSTPPIYPPAPVSTISIRAPHAGETWKLGEQRDIRWEDNAPAGTSYEVYIATPTDGANRINMRKLAVVSEKKLRWTVGQNLTANQILPGNYVIVVGQTTNGGNSSISAPFNITANHAYLFGNSQTASVSDSLGSWWYETFPSWFGN